MKFYTIPNAVLDLRYERGRMVVEAESLQHAKVLFLSDLLHQAEVAINTQRIHKKRWNRDIEISLNIKDIEVLE